MFKSNMLGRLLLLGLCTLWPTVSFAGPSTGAEEVVSFAGDDWATSGLATEAKQDDLIASVDDVETKLDTIASNQLANGHDVTVDNGSGAAAVNIQDGGNSITIDGSITANAGTNLNTSALALESGGNLDSIKDSLGVLEGTVSGSELQVDLVDIGAIATESTLSSIDTTLSGTGSSAQEIQGSVAAGASIAAINPVPICFQDALGQCAVPTGINAGGLTVLGSVPVDISAHIQDFTPTGEIYALTHSTTAAKGGATYARTDSNSNTQIVGEVANDAADSGNPIKIGGVAESDYESYNTSQEGSSDGVDDRDRRDITVDPYGRVPEVVVKKYTEVDTIVTTYDNTTTTATSSAIDVALYRFASFSVNIESSGSPTKLVITIQCSPDNTNYFDIKSGALGFWVFDDTYTSANPTETVHLELACNYIKIKVTTTGTGASDTFTINNFLASFRN